MDEKLEAAKDRAWRSVAAIDAAYARGEFDDDQWHRAMAAFIVPVYLHADSVRGGSGHTGSADEWEWSRGIVAEALDRDGTFLDVGCANGLLMESVAAWGAAAGHAIEPYGLDISPELAGEARRRLPHWADRIFAGNALGWRPRRRWDVVRTGLEYVPPPRRRELVAWLLDEVVAPGGRLIVGKYNEEIQQRTTEGDLIRWGFVLSGRADRAHRTEPRLAYRIVWLDAPDLTGGALRLRSLRPSDLPDLQRWLAEPHVQAWWREPVDLESVRRRFLPGMQGTEPISRLILEWEGRSIGWIQWYRWRDYPAHAAQIGAEPTTTGLDLAIGEPTLTGRGIGRRAIGLLLREVILRDPGVTACVCDPEEANARSVRCFERAGFTLAAQVHVSGESSARRVVRYPAPLR
jgi:RimJ/RimL family protein N-acetyltransferase